jgi:CRISPR-associated protein Cmr1
MPKPEAITIKLKTVTPIWTGGIERDQMEYVKGSSIMGGMRFWAEAYFRALGEKICDITGENKCIYDKQKNKNICKVCELFGCTGKSRTFALKVNAFSWNEKRGGRLFLDEFKYKDKRGRDKVPTWFLKSGFNGKFLLQMTPLLSQQIDPVVLFFLKIMLNWGTIGAQDQYGYGVVEPEGNILDNIKIQGNIFKNLPNKPLSSNDYPAFGDFFFFIANMKTSNNSNKIPFKIRYKVRFELRKNLKEKALRHYFCGSMKSDKTATKYNIALTPDGTLRGWGWFPSRGRFDKYRDKCLDLLKNQINSFAKPGTLKWKEFASKRDNVNSAKSWPEFLQELADGKLVDLLKRK